MYLILTRSFPPELGGMQNLMWGLSRELSKNFMIKVFADHIEGHKNFVPVNVGESDLLIAMKLIAKTGKGPEDQIPSAGCGIKWKYD